MGDHFSMSYEYDLFISYKTDCQTTPWMRDTFLVELRRLLAPLRINGLSIFDDDQIRVGSNWPQVLHTKIAQSRLLLPILTPRYFGSNWCRKELAIMLERQQLLGLCSSQNLQGLVIPIQVWDGHKYPKVLKDHVQLVDFVGLTEVRRGTKKWTKFQDKMRYLAEAIDDILNTVPPYDTCWTNITGEEFEPLLRVSEPSHYPLPRLTNPDSIDSTFQNNQLEGQSL